MSVSAAVEQMIETVPSADCGHPSAVLGDTLGGLFGLGDGSKPDGSTASRALFVQFAGSPLAVAGAGIGSLPLGNLGGIAGLLNSGSSSSSSGSGVLGSIGQGIAGVFGKIGSFFGGFLAGGGDVTPGKAYIVGEKPPELFVPRSAGTVVSSVPNGGDTKIVNVGGVHFHGVTDGDSFKKSPTQISSQMSRATSIGLARNGR
jgi:hypothetical protein